MESTLFFLGTRPVTGFETLIAAAAVVAVLFLVGLVVVMRQARRGAELEAIAAEQARDAEARFTELMKLHAEMTGRLTAMTDLIGNRQAESVRAVSETSKTLNDRLDQLTHRLGHSMVETTRSTHESLRQVHERLAVIDRAHKTIGELTGQVTQLQSILSNKQTRGAFGQGRMEAIIADALPPDGFSFQSQLSTGVRPDCLVHLPNGTPPLAIDAKFPLEAWTAWRAAEGDEAKKAAGQQMRRDVLKHVADIREKYLIPGETQETAFLFVPSESIFADLHEHFDDVVQRAHRGRVVIVSPSLLVLSVQVVQAVLRDHRMREQAHVIQKEVAVLTEDVVRLHERVLKLQGHFGQATKDIEQIVISAEKVEKRGARIEALDLGEAPATGGVIPAPIGAHRLAGE